MDIAIISGAEILPYLAFIGIGLLVLEFLLPTKGILGVIGAGLFVTGTIALTTHPDPNIRISIAACIMLNIVVLGTVGILFYLTWRGYNKTPKEPGAVEGAIAQVIDWNTQHKRVELEGAVWSAATMNNAPLTKGQKVRVIARDNLILIVELIGA